MDISQISVRQQLIDYLSYGNRAKYLYFWEHQPDRDGSAGKSCFSQWYEAGFELNKIKYPTAEYYMTAEKARLFNDAKILAKILAAPHPGEAKNSVAKLKVLMNQSGLNIVRQLWLEATGISSSKIEL